MTEAEALKAVGTVGVIGVIIYVWLIFFGKRK